MKNHTFNMLMGVAVGDALGVPFEFQSRLERDFEPATDMVGFGAHHQPAGTWSDDSSLTFCLSEAIIEGYSLENTAKWLTSWLYQKTWTARNDVFDIGITTRESLQLLKSKIDKGLSDEFKHLKYRANHMDNGNGSLMRILPLLFVIKSKPIEEQFEIVWDNSALTHRHVRAAMCCMIYLKIAEYLCEGENKIKAYHKTQKEIKALWKAIDFNLEEQRLFEKVIDNDISKYTKNEIRSGGYVMESLECALWCFLNTDSFKDAVLSAVNMGSDTDTNAAITGGLAGLYYGVESIPMDWLDKLARKEDIEDLAKRLNEKQ
ncbi:MAG: ADP-ribosylglycohydrolase family protein [Bacteroidia bacterium]